MQQQQYYHAERRAKLWAALFFVLLNLILLFLMSMFATKFFCLVLALELSIGLLILAIRARKPLFIYWSLHACAWFLGAGLAWTWLIAFAPYYDWNGFWLWLYLPMSMSLLLALFQNALIAVLRRTFPSVAPKNASVHEDFSTGYETDYVPHIRRRISDAHPRQAAD